MEKSLISDIKLDSVSLMEVIAEILMYYNMNIKAEEIKEWRSTSLYG